MRNINKLSFTLNGFQISRNFKKKQQSKFKKQINQSQINIVKKTFIKVIKK